MEQGLILGRYRPLAELGDGGHGAVDLAFDTKMSRRVAVKRIPLSHAGVRKLSGTTGLQEARTAALLNHPNIVTVHEWDTDEDEAFLIMEHVDGVSLASLLDEYAPLDLDEAAAIMTPVCAALSYAHANGVLHLDLKPENVLVTRDGLVKVADFGVASLTNAAGQAISAGGTLGYMPPEQLRGDPVDARSDVWTLASLAYEVLTGSVPFSADTIRSALYKAENVTPPMPSEFVRGLPAALDDALAVALTPSRSGRHASAERLAEELLPLLGDVEIGTEGLRRLVAPLVDEESSSQRLPQPGLWDRLLHLEPALLRAAAGLAAAALAWTGVSALDIGWPAALGAAAAAGAAGTFAPPYGLTAGLLALIAGVFTLGPLQGLFAAVTGAAWWIVLGRRAGWAGLVPLCAPLFGVLGIAPALPLLAGLAVRDIWKAFVAGAAAGTVLVLASTASGSGPASLSVSAAAFLDPLHHAARSSLALTPQEMLAATALVISWGAAAGVSSLLARRATRGSAVLGSGIGIALLLGGIGPWMTGGQQLTARTALQFGLSSILVAVVIALGPPVADATDE